MNGQLAMVGEKEYNGFMTTTQTRIKDLKSAHRLFKVKRDDDAAKALVAATAGIFGWTSELAKVRIQEFLWEIGLLPRGRDKRIRLSQEIFFRYATSVHRKGFIPMAARP